MEEHVEKMSKSQKSKKTLSDEERESRKENKLKAQLESQANLLEYRKKYYIENKERFWGDQNDKLKCELCNRIYTKAHRLRHERSHLHVKCIPAEIKVICENEK